MLVKIVRLDMDGFNGREYHPEPTDLGLTVRVIHMEVWPNDIAPCNVQSLDSLIPYVNKDPKAPQAVLDTLASGEVYYLFTAVTDDGRILELVGHEVEPASGGRDWLG